MKTCTNCGYEVKPGDVFCGNCGAGQAGAGANADQDAPVHVPGFGEPSTLSDGPGFPAAAAETQVRSDPPRAAAMGTAGPGTAGIGTAGMGAASMGAASMGAASMGAAGMGAAGMGAASMGTTSYGPASPAHEPLGQHATQEAYFAGTRSTTRTAPVSAQEATELKYLRHTRNATVFIAIIVGIFTAIALIGVIWTAVTVAKLNSDLNGVSNGINSNFNSNCASQGGTNPDC